MSLNNQDRQSRRRSIYARTASVGIAENEEQLLAAIDQLVAYSLLDVAFAAGQQRYGIHQLTRQFVNSELPKLWQEQGLS